MKVLFLAPWFRTLAVGWADALRERGHEVRVVTTTQHFDPPPVHPDDIVFAHRWRASGGVAEFLRAAAELARWRPDVVITDPVSDPRYTLLSFTGRAQLVTTHDARPHDATHRMPLLRKVNTRVLMAKAGAEIVFSEYVKRALGDRGHPVEVLPLLSEMHESGVPPFVPAEGRHDFVVIGRLSPYKNVPTILRAFDLHRSSPAYRGDRLVIIGDGNPGCDVPADVEWVNERFRFTDIAPRLAAAKASICLYSAGSQSGVQVWAMQCGTASVVSEVGALREYLPAGETVVDHGDAAELAARLDRLADPVEAERLGRLHHDEYLRRLQPSMVAEAWEGVFRRVTKGDLRG